MGVTSKSTVYLSLGSNLGDRFQHLLDAQNELSETIGEIVSVSHIYENPPNGFEAEHDFLNLCLKMNTELSALQLLDKIKEIEHRMGRKLSNLNGYTSRCIDIDIILYNDCQIQSEKLTIPHPHFRKRMFVLKPLNDIAFNETDPQTMLTIEQLLNNCTDQSTMCIFNH